MVLTHKKEPLILFIGDIFSCLLGLWLTLLLRYGSLPSERLLEVHFLPFSFLFIVSIIVFFIAGLYDNQALMTRKELPGRIMNAQVANSIFAIFFFYILPFLGITPKVTLFLYLLLSSVLILLWRLWGAKMFVSRNPESALLAGSGEEIAELLQEVNGNNRYGMKFIASIDLDKARNLSPEEFLQKVEQAGATFVVLDLFDDRVRPVLSSLYNLIFSQIRFINIHELYESIFGRVPISLVHYNWFLENVSRSPNASYDILKRAMDFSIALVLGIVSLVIYPFVYLAIKLDDGGSLWSIQERIGKNNERIKLFKFRTMSIANDRGGGVRDEGNRVTRVGKFFRVTRIDELPQLWNVLKGDLSLIGPRPEFPDLVKKYSEAIPYYSVRHLIKPGLSGWAQIYHENHPHHVADIAETRNKLSYDLYYIKHRSLFLDVKIALRTVQTLLSRSGA